MPSTLPVNWRLIEVWTAYTTDPLKLLPSCPRASQNCAISSPKLGMTGCSSLNSEVWRFRLKPPNSKLRNSNFCTHSTPTQSSLQNNSRNSVCLQQWFLKKYFKFLKLQTICLKLFVSTVSQTRLLHLVCLKGGCYTRLCY